MQQHDRNIHIVCTHIRVYTYSIIFICTLKVYTGMKIFLCVVDFHFALYNMLYMVYTNISSVYGSHENEVASLVVVPFSGHSHTQQHCIQQHHYSKEHIEQSVNSSYSQGQR